MEENNIKFSKSKEINTVELDEISGGNVLQMTYYMNYGSPTQNKSDIYYVPKNGKFYKNVSTATAVDKDLGGKGLISTNVEYYDTDMPYLEDASNYAWEFNDSRKGKG